jgi:hypothetical protein
MFFTSPSFFSSCCNAVKIGLKIVVAKEFLQQTIIGLLNKPEQLQAYGLLGELSGIEFPREAFLRFAAKNAVGRTGIPTPGSTLMRAAGGGGSFVWLCTSQRAEEE